MLILTSIKYFCPSLYHGILLIRADCLKRQPLTNITHACIQDYILTMEKKHTNYMHAHSSEVHKTAMQLRDLPANRVSSYMAMYTHPLV